MGKILRSFLALAIAIAALVYVLGLKREDSAPVRPSESPTPLASPVAETVGEASPAPSPSGTPAAAEVSEPEERVIDFTPKRETYRTEVDRDPHGTPPSLQHFARRMAAKMETGMRTESAARALIPELHDCARNSEVESPRAVCVMNGRRLARKFPNLQSDWAEFEASLPPLLQKRVEQLERF